MLYLCNCQWGLLGEMPGDCLKKERMFYTVGMITMYVLGFAGTICDHNFAMGLMGFVWTEHCFKSWNATW